MIFIERTTIVILSFKNKKGVYSFSKKTVVLRKWNDK